MPSGVEHAAHSSYQVQLCERLQDQLDVRIEPALVNDGDTCIACRKEHLQRCAPEVRLKKRVEGWQ